MSNKRRRLLTDDDDDESESDDPVSFEQLPLNDVIPFLEYKELLSLAAVSTPALAAVESGMERLYDQDILQKHDRDASFADRVAEPPNNSQLVSPLPFRYLVRKAMNTHLYELTDTFKELSETEILHMEMLVLSPSGDRVAVITTDDDTEDHIRIIYRSVFVYDLNTKQRLGGPLMRFEDGEVDGLYFLDDGGIVSYSPYKIRIWTMQENSKWMVRISYNNPQGKKIAGWVVYQHREILFALNTDSGSGSIYEIKSLDVSDGSIRDVFTIDCREEEFAINLTEDARKPLLQRMDILGDRWLLLNFSNFDPITREIFADLGDRDQLVAGNVFVYDLETLQRVQSLAGIYWPMKGELPMKNSQSQSKYIYEVFDQNNNNTYVRALQLGDDGLLSPLESFGMQIPDHGRWRYVREVSDHQLVMDDEHRSELFVYDLATGEHVHTLPRGRCVISATRNEILVAILDESHSQLQIRAYCLEEPRLCNLD